MKRRAYIYWSLCLALALVGCHAPKTQEAATNSLPDWQQGYLDIHQISTGRGDAAFMILPDGTTLLVDAGDLGVFTGKQEIMPQVPDDSKRPAEWIARYITHFSAPLKNGGAIDYALLTHYDDDHIGQAWLWKKSVWIIS